MSAALAMVITCWLLVGPWWVRRYWPQTLILELWGIVAMEVTAFLVTGMLVGTMFTLFQ